MDFEIGTEDINCMELLSIPFAREKIISLLQNAEQFVLFWINKDCGDEIFSDAFVAGSLGEGIAGVPFLMQKQTDGDFMLTLNRIHAVERHYVRSNPDVEILKVEHSDLFPGYALLRKCDGNLSTSYFSADDLKNYFGEVAISDAFGNCFGIVLNCFNAIHGPACMTHLTFDSGSIFRYLESTDNVFSIHCDEWPSVADEWFQRNRKYNWPSPNQIADIVGMGCDFVPVGFPGSETENLEWRVSFVKAERSLIHSMNDAQIKTFCLLKVLFKDKVFGEFFHHKIPSYVAKTTLLWISEEHNATEWSDNLCLKYLWLCLRRIMNCVIEGHCSNYFMRECNLLHGKINNHEKETLMHLLDNFTRRKYFINNMKSLPVISGMKYAFFGILPLVKGLILENEMMKSLIAKFLNRCLEEFIGNMMFWFFSISQNNNWRESVMELQNYMSIIKRNRSRFIELSMSDFLIRLLSCAQIRLVNVAISRDELSHSDIVSIINKLLQKANLRTETLCVSEITQIAHLFFTNELYENALHIIEPMLNAFRNIRCIRIHSIASMFRMFSHFLLDMDNVTFTSTRRPVSNITFFNLEESILTNHLRIEIVSSMVEREQNVESPFVYQFNVAMSPLIYAYYMKYKCHRNLGNNIYSCQVLKELIREILQEESHRYHGLNLLGSSLYESGYLEDALKAFAMAFKERNSRRSTLYHTAILLRKCFDDQ